MALFYTLVLLYCSNSQGHNSQHTGDFLYVACVWDSVHLPGFCGLHLRALIECQQLSARSHCHSRGFEWKNLPLFEHFTILIRKFPSEKTFLSKSESRQQRPRYSDIWFQGLCYTMDHPFCVSFFLFIDRWCTSERLDGTTDTGCMDGWINGWKWYLRKLYGLHIHFSVPMLYWS